MAVSVAEYLGVRADKLPNIKPVTNLASKPEVPCPFRIGPCLKVAKAQHPICSVRVSTSNDVWIVCEHRLCATQPKTADLNEHQQQILRQVADTVYPRSVPDGELEFKREVSIPIATTRYHADYVMRTGTELRHANIVEMQGGGETAGTEKLTKHVLEWAGSESPTNEHLVKKSAANPIVTNAWRRQQEQFIIKGGVATRTGGKMIFCVGTMLYDYVISRLETATLKDLRRDNWTLALLAFKEDPSKPAPRCAPNSIQYTIDEERTVFTDYSTFVQALANQGDAQSEIFQGEFTTLDNKRVSR